MGAELIRRGNGWAYRFGDSSSTATAPAWMPSRWRGCRSRPATATCASCGRGRSRARRRICASTALPSSLGRFAPRRARCGDQRLFPRSRRLAAGVHLVRLRRVGQNGVRPLTSTCGETNAQRQGSDPVLRAAHFFFCFSSSLISSGSAPRRRAPASRIRPPRHCMATPISIRSRPPSCTELTADGGRVGRMAGDREGPDRVAGLVVDGHIGLVAEISGSFSVLVRRSNRASGASRGRPHRSSARRRRRAREAPSAAAAKPQDAFMRPLRCVAALDRPLQDEPRALPLLLVQILDHALVEHVEIAPELCAGRLRSVAVDGGRDLQEAPTLHHAAADHGRMGRVRRQREGPQACRCCRPPAPRRRRCGASRAASCPWKAARRAPAGAALALPHSSSAAAVRRR